MNVRIFNIGLLKSIKLKIGLTGIIILLIISLVSPIFFAYNPSEMFTFPLLLPPSTDHIFGTDGYGRDVIAYTLPAIKNTMSIAILAAALSSVISLVVGFTSGYFRNLLTSTLLKWFIDAFLTIPSLPFIVLFTSMLKQINIFTLGMMLSLFSWAGGARAIMAQCLSIRERDYMQTLALSNAGNFEVFKDVTLSLLPYIIASFLNSIRTAMMMETGISILGLGRHQTTLGKILYDSCIMRAGIVRGLWWWWLPSIILLSVILILLYVINMGFDEIIDPRITRKR